MPEPVELLRDIPRRIGYVHGPRLMSRLRKWWVLLRHPHANISFTEPVYLGPGFSLHIPAGGTFTAGPYCEFRRNFRAEISGDGRVEIGAGSVFTYDVVIQCSTSIVIGERCVLAQGALLVDGSHRFRELDRPLLEQGYDFRPLRIGDEAMVSAKCTVIASLGQRCMVGANSVVVEDVPPYSLAVGAPARVIEHFGPANLSLTDAPPAPRAARRGG